MTPCPQQKPSKLEEMPTRPTHTIPPSRWIGTLPFDDNPIFINPVSGLLGNTNNKTVDRPFPKHVSFDWGDTQRIQRALEIWHTTGRPLSAFHTQRDEAAITAKQANTILLSLEPQDRSWLHERIAVRFDAMLAGGLVEEVKTLKARSDLHSDLPSIRCVGYRQVWEYLDIEGSPKDWSDMRERGIAATRQLAKRQLTWLRGWQGKISLSQIGSTYTWVVDQILGLTTHRHQA